MLYSKAIGCKIGVVDLNCLGEHISGSQAAPDKKVDKTYQMYYFNSTFNSTIILHCKIMFLESFS